MQIGGKTLKEIAEMPLREMTLFMREHHDRRRSVPANRHTYYTVRVAFSGESTVRVEALSDQHAEEQAKREIQMSMDQLDDCDLDIDDTKIIKHEIY